jgi:hypothetical protein
MKERPILFSAPMVRTILSGLKSQTRRLVKPQPAWVYGETVPVRTDDADPKGAIPCPYGQPGDRLWVRETHCPVVPRYGSSDPLALYRADLDPGQQYMCVERWTPAIHMPRRLSRITLEVTRVRVERLQDISASDCRAEGVDPPKFNEVTLWRRQYEAVWGQINGPGSWDANPWVWVIDFKRVI